MNKINKFFHKEKDPEYYKECRRAEFDNLYKKYVPMIHVKDEFIKIMHVHDELIEMKDEIHMNSIIQRYKEYTKGYIAIKDDKTISVTFDHTMALNIEVIRKLLSSFLSDKEIDNLIKE